MRWLRTAMLSGVVALATGCAGPPPPAFVTGPEAETSPDGLQRLEHGRFEQAWARPGAPFSNYQGLWPRYLGIHYRKAPQRKAPQRKAPQRKASGPPSHDPRPEGLQQAQLRSGPMWARRSVYPLPDGVRDALLQSFQQAFDQAIASAPDLRPATAGGPGVLVARMALVDLVLSVPLQTPGDEDYTWADSVGAFTVVMELVDSETGQVVMRVAERRKIATQSGRPIRAAPGDAEFEADRIFRDWAQKLVSLLEGARTANLSPGGPSAAGT